MERSKVYFVSDVHLGLKVKDPAAREARFVSFLRSIPKEDTTALYLLGDIWDFWYEYRDVVPKGYVRVFSALQELMEAGVEVIFFPGNHDIWTFGYFESLGMKVVRSKYEMISHQGLRLCVGHGDGIGEGMRMYKLMRWGFHNRLLQKLFTQLHPWMAFRLGEGWSRRSRLARSIPYEFRGQEEPLYRWAADMAAREDGGINLFIFGHYHTAVDMPVLGSGGVLSRLVILKDWMEGTHYAVLEGGQLEVF